MTVSELIAKLSSYPEDARVTLMDADKRWLLPITITHLSADESTCGVDFIAITADSARDEIEGIAKCGFDRAFPISDTGDEGDHPKIQHREN
jgi:hypothetical protein